MGVDTFFSTSAVNNISAVVKDGGGARCLNSFHKFLRTTILRQPTSRAMLASEVSEISPKTI